MVIVCVCSVDKAQGQRLIILITRGKHPRETRSYWYNDMEVSREKGTAIKTTHSFLPGEADAWERSFVELL